MSRVVNDNYSKIGSRIAMQYRGIINHLLVFFLYDQYNIKHKLGKSIDLSFVSGQLTAIGIQFSPFSSGFNEFANTKKGLSYRLRALCIRFRLPISFARKTIYCKKKKNQNKLDELKIKGRLKLANSIDRKNDFPGFQAIYKVIRKLINEESKPAVKLRYRYRLLTMMVYQYCYLSEGDGEKLATLYKTEIVISEFIKDLNLPLEEIRFIKNFINDEVDEDNIPYRLNEIDDRLKSMGGDDVNTVTHPFGKRLQLKSCTALKEIHALCLCLTKQNYKEVIQKYISPAEVNIYKGQLQKLASDVEKTEFTQIPNLVEKAEHYHEPILIDKYIKPILNPSFQLKSIDCDGYLYFYLSHIGWKIGCTEKDIFEYLTGDARHKEWMKNTETFYCIAINGITPFKVEKKWRDNINRLPQFSPIKKHREIFVSTHHDVFHNLQSMKTTLSQALDIEEEVLDYHLVVNLSCALLTPLELRTCKPLEVITSLGD
ncbi:hypothetical protein UA32_04110 [Photobacterium angustum]|uniref:Uncharacterized protein n=1 Tax=Photobacterium angustum TaxID=661 RepID=A0ABX5H492_PHOAN|nr:hypothetical protein [Photobacterium angustum]KJG39532.1 hypothetical protein UA32_04110 [Photobacterium angustum]PSX10506.1 hypothetical protein C0W27_10775 [Photobacterium angustum]